MKFNGILTLVVTVLAVVLISSACIIPVVQSAQEEQYSTDNNANFRFKMIEGTDSIVISADATGFNINATHYDVSGIVTIAISPTIQISYYSGGGTYNMAIQDALTATAISVSGSNTITLANNAYTVNTSTPTTGTYDAPLYVADANGDYANYLGTSASPFFIDNDGVLTGYLQTSITVGENTVALRGIFKGTIDELKFVSAFNNTTHEVIPVNALSIAFASNSVPVEIDSVHSQISGRSFDVKYTVEGVDYTSNGVIAQNGLVAPVEYKYISDSDNVIIAMLGIIPVLLLLIPIMLVVRSFAVGRD